MKKLFVLTICLVLVPYLLSAEDGKKLRPSGAYELKSRGFVRGTGINLDLILDFKGNKIAFKKVEIEEGTPLGLISKKEMNDKPGEEIQIESIKYEKDELVISGYDSDDTYLVKVKIRLFLKKGSKTSFESGLVDIESSNNTTGDKWTLSFNDIWVGVSKIR